MFTEVKGNERLGIIRRSVSLSYGLADIWECEAFGSLPPAQVAKAGVKIRHLSKAPFLRQRGHLPRSVASLFLRLCAELPRLPGRKGECAYHLRPC